MKYILVTGGTISGLGKGVLTSSLGALLKACDLRVTAIKIDPYINVDAGLFSPYEHGEVFVLNDGSEVDLDLGNYERFLDTDLGGRNNITTGKLMLEIVGRERKGLYDGATVQTVPHLTNLIVEWISSAAHEQHADVCLIELGGTIGDIETRSWIEGLRQLADREEGNFCGFHLDYVPRIGEPGDEQDKSKPTQNSLRTLVKSNLRKPNIVVLRCATPTSASLKDKIAFSSGLKRDHIIDMPTLGTIYAAPIELEKQGIIELISNVLNMDLKCKGLERWTQIIQIATNCPKTFRVALVGKYTKLRDSYLSIKHALEHACFAFDAKLEMIYIESDKLEDPSSPSWHELEKADCLLLPGGFGHRGTEGKIKAIHYARVHKIPFLGICLGFQLAAIEYARNEIGIEKANSAEFDQDIKQDYEPIVIEMLDYKDPEGKMGGTMRLGVKKTVFNTEDSLLRSKYNGVSSIHERHRHRYEINPIYIDKLQSKDLKFTGTSEDKTRMEVLELDPAVHPYFIAVQFHPEYKTRPFKPSPPYFGLIEAASRRRVPNGTKA